MGNADEFDLFIYLFTRTFKFAFIHGSIHKSFGLFLDPSQFAWASQHDNNIQLLPQILNKMSAHALPCTDAAPAAPSGHPPSVYMGWSCPENRANTGGSLKIVRLGH